MSDQESIVFLGIDVDFFKKCFFREKNPTQPSPYRAKHDETNWENFKLVNLDTRSATVFTDLSEALKNPNVRSVAFEDTDLEGELLSTLKDFYNDGGLVAFFGINGKLDDASRLSSLFGLPEPWSFSAYSSHEFELTYTAMDFVGFSVQQQERAKSSLLKVPIQDRWMVPKAQPLHIYVEENAGCLDGEAPDEEWNAQAEKAKAGYATYCEDLYKQCPLAVHSNDRGGRLAYLGFVNGRGKIPYIVRSLMTKKVDDTESRS